MQKSGFFKTWCFSSHPGARASSFVPGFPRTSFTDSPLGEFPHVKQIFVATAGKLIRDQVVTADDHDLHSIDFHFDAIGITIFKRNTGNPIEDLQSHGFESGSNQPSVFQEIVRRDFASSETELMIGRANRIGIFAGSLDEDVHIAGKPIVTVQDDGVPADEQVLCTMLVQ